MDQNKLQTIYKSGFVAIVGRGNVGKSTLLNHLVGAKLSIVSSKPHTTRYKLLGVLHDENFQIAFLDTPGYLSQVRDKLDTVMEHQATSVMADADLVALVVEPRRPGRVEHLFINQIAHLGIPSLLVVNKIDTVSKVKLLPVIEAYAQSHQFLDIVPVSAKNNEGLDILLSQIRDHLPRDEPIFEMDTLTDRSTWFRMAELIREKVYELYDHEVPYYVAVEIEDYHEREGTKPHYLAATIYVDRLSQRRLLIGKGGHALKEVGVRARPDIEAFIGHAVYLELWVKVRPNWRENLNFIGRQL